MHDGYEELMKGACGLDPQLEREGERRRHGIEMGRELFEPEYNELGLAMSEASKLLKAMSTFDGWDHAALVLA